MKREISREILALKGKVVGLILSFQLMLPELTRAFPLIRNEERNEFSGGA